MLLFVGNVTTIKFRNCKFYCREILLSLRRLPIETLLFYSASGRFARITRISDLRASPDSVCVVFCCDSPALCRFAFGRLTWPWGCCIEKGGTPKRGVLWVSAFPKGPFRTKNAIALKIVVKYYRGSIFPSVPVGCHFAQEK